jgi:hypothetical protein
MSLDSKYGRWLAGETLVNRDLGRLLILLGGVLLLAGIALTAFGRLGLGRLPGDFVHRRGNFSFISH